MTTELENRYHNYFAPSRDIPIERETLKWKREGRSVPGWLDYFIYFSVTGWLDYFIHFRSSIKMNICPIVHTIC